MIFKLLVVDDEVTMRKGISNYMNWASIDCQVVGSASDGMEAIDFLKKSSCGYRNHRYQNARCRADWK